MMCMEQTKKMASSIRSDNSEALEPGFVFEIKIDLRMPFFLSLQQNIELSKVSKNYTTLFFLSKTLETCFNDKNFLI